MSMSPVKVRKSKWSLWLICPRLYEQRFLKNRPMRNSVEMQYGRDFHSRAKEFFDEIDTGTLIHCNNAVHAFNLFKFFIPRRSSVIREWMRHFLWWEAKQWEKLFGDFGKEAITYWKPLATELHIEVDGSTYHVDRIDRLPIGSLINIEYKTSKVLMKSKLRLELTWYNIGVNLSKKFNLPCKYIGYYNPQLDKFFSEPVKGYVKEDLKRLIEHFHLAHKENLFPCDKSDFCRYCSYLDDCPCWQNWR